MKINTALILCAGFGRRLNPITFKTPKPLLKIKNLTLLERCINLVNSLGIKKVLINSFYLKEKIYKFIQNNDFDLEIEVIEDGNKILNTGGGILNLIDKSDEENYLIFNSDTIWSEDYKSEIKHMIDLYFNRKLKNILLLVNKNSSFDKNLKVDFDLNNNLIIQNKKNFIYTGCQILNKSIFKNKTINNFSISEIWFDLIKDCQLSGYESKLKFYHVTNLEIFKKLQGL